MNNSFKASFEEEAQPVLTDVLLQPSTAVAICCSHPVQVCPFLTMLKIREIDNFSFTIPSGLTIYSGNQRRLDILADLQESPCHIWLVNIKINVATAFEVCFCTCSVVQTRTCRSTILGSQIVEMGTYCSYVSVALGIVVTLQQKHAKSRV